MDHLIIIISITELCQTALIVASLIVITEKSMSSHHFTGVEGKREQGEEEGRWRRKREGRESVREREEEKGGGEGRTGRRGLLCSLVIVTSELPVQSSSFLIKS
jgi:hypothetical protein